MADYNILLQDSQENNYYTHACTVGGKPATAFATAEQGERADAALPKTGDASDTTAAFTPAAVRANLTTGEKLSAMLGKIAKFFADLKTVAFTGNYNDLTNKPTSLPAEGGTADTVRDTHQNGQLYFYAAADYDNPNKPLHLWGTSDTPHCNFLYDINELSVRSAELLRLRASTGALEDGGMYAQYRNGNYQLMLYGTNASSAYVSVDKASDADTVSGRTVATNVPANAKFTDTVYTHPSSGVTAGTYRSVTVNAQGHVTGGTKPTTLAGYGITDAAAKTHTHTAGQITDFPASLKNPTALTLQLNGTVNQTYDGSAAKTFNVTPASIGAVPTTRTVAGKALSANITLTKSDVGLGNVNNAAALPLAGGTMAGAINMNGKRLENINPTMTFHNNTGGIEVSGAGNNFYLGNGWYNFYGNDKVTFGTVAAQISNQSSRTVKKNIAALDAQAAQKVLQLRPVEFDYKQDGKHSLGFLAQEVLELFPEVVSMQDKNNEDTWGLYETRLIAPLVKLCQMQQVQIDALRAEVDALSAAQDKNTQV